MENQPTVELIPIDVEGEILTVSSLNFAEGLGIQHKNLLATITKYQKEIEADFGLIAFETRKIESPSGKGRPVNVAHLTEDQALFVGSLSNNSKRVINFKATLVKSFAEARKLIQQKLLAPPALSSEQLLIQLASQQTQMLANQQEQINQLRQEVSQLSAGTVKPLFAQPLLPLQFGPPKGRTGRESLRQLIQRRIEEYCGFHNATQSETYSYLYKRMFAVYGISAYQLTKRNGESIIDAVERYGHLDKLYSLIRAELAYPEE